MRKMVQNVKVEIESTKKSQIEEKLEMKILGTRTKAAEKNLTNRTRIREKACKRKSQALKTR